MSLSTITWSTWQCLPDSKQVRDGLERMSSTQPLCKDALASGAFIHQLFDDMSCLILIKCIFCLGFVHPTSRMICISFVSLLPSEHFAMDSQSSIVTGIIGLALNLSVYSSEIVHCNFKRYVRVSAAQYFT